MIERAPWSDELATTVSGDATFAVERLTPERWRLSLRATVPSEIVLRLHDFPGWAVRGDGATRLDPEPRTGRLRLRVEPGTWSPELVLRRTPIQLAGIVMSILALIGIAGLNLLPRHGNRQTKCIESMWTRVSCDATCRTIRDAGPATRCRQHEVLALKNELRVEQCDDPAVKPKCPSCKEVMEKLLSIRVARGFWSLDHSNLVVCPHCHAKCWGTER